MKQLKQFIGVLVLITPFTSTSLWAHDPVFGIGPHVLFKGGTEIALELESGKAGDRKARGLALDLKYGITGDWAVGINMPYEYKDDGTRSADAMGDVSISTKYRFWREDSLGLQESAAVSLKVVTDMGKTSSTPSIGSGATDTILGLTYGYEGRKWYRWASARYRFNGKNDAGVERGDKLLIDFVGGIRPTLTNYLEPDTVWLLELNGEFGENAELNGNNLRNTGGTEWFLSPGVFWTKRNFAIKAGVQLPIYSNLNGTQEKSDYRAKVSFEWHF